MFLLLKRKWRNGPLSDSVSVNWSNPLANGLTYCQLPGAARRPFFNFNNPQITSFDVGQSLIYSNNPNISGGNSGPGIFEGQTAISDKAGTALGTFTIKPSSSGGNPVYTYAGVYEVNNSTTVTQAGATFALNGTNARINVNKPQLSSVTTFLTNFVDGSSVTQTYSAVVSSLVKIKRPNVAISIYENGQVPIGIFNANTLSFANSTVFDGVSTTFSNNYIDVPTLSSSTVGMALFFWARKLNQTEIQSFTENPWQLFTFAKPIVYAPSAPVTYSYSRPAADSFILDWASTGANHYSQVNGTDPNQTSTYNYATFPNAEDWYTFSAVSLPLAASNISLNFVCNDMGSPTGAKVKIGVYEQISFGIYTMIHEETVTVTNAIQTLTITPAEWANVVTWPWSPNFRITAL